MSEAPWLVVVDPTCTVIAVAGGAPDRWSGRPMSELATEAPSIQAAAVELVRSVGRGAGSGYRAVSHGGANGPVQVGVIAVSALAIVRRRSELAAIAQRALEPFRGQAGDRDIELRLVAPPAPITVMVDEAKIVWVISTLVANALRFARTGTRHLPGGTVTVRLARNDAGRTALMWVEDDGPGIEADRLARLFERRDASTPATGVALMMARDVVAAHGGSLSVESSTDVERHGTTVRAEIPVR